MEIFYRFIDIVKDIEKPVIFEFGTCDGQHTNIMCGILKQMNKKFTYHAFEADYRIVPIFWQNNQNHVNEIIFNNSAIGNTDGIVKFNLSGGEEKREGHFKQAFYGSSSIKKPNKVVEFWPDMTFEETEVNCYKFDTYYNSNVIKNIDFIWADLQGAEGDLIDGGQVALSNTRYLYTEYSNEKLYEGEIGISEIVKKLPGNWSIIEDYGSDVLLKNELIN
jgi:FkbM family methyltransferase